ncbi:MAG: helix-hairpin-helix domain-containing protein [Thermoflexaceae bacterium]|nr:helix-hairpin-helix domain-containing protein [Thermoflexaceae bacterium]
MHNKKLNIIIAVSAFLILGTAYFCLWNRQEMPQDLFGETKSMVFVAESMEETESMAVMESSPQIYVYVCGFVNQPGVYELCEGARMFEAVDMAGGICDGGCVDYLEMASVLKDGMRIYVPSVEEAAQMEDGTASGTSVQGRININRAAREELMTLPGIGGTKADAIIRYREEHGGFTTIEEIKNISGIKEAAFSKIRDYICVDS